MGRWVAAGVSAFCLAAGSAQAATQGTSVFGGGAVYSNFATVYTPYGDFNINSPGFSPVAYGAPVVTGANLWNWSASHAGDGNFYASATPATQTLRSASAAASIGGTENRAQVTSGYQGHLVTVAATSTGVNVGDAVTLQFALRVDGTLAADNGVYPPGTAITLPSEYGYAASATVSMNYLVYDLDVDNEVAALKFQYDANTTYGYSKDQYTDVKSDTFSSIGRYTNDSGWNWTDLAGNVQIDNTQSPVPLVVGTTPRNVHAVDTGYVIITLDTYVGHTLSIDASLYTEAAGWGDLRMAALSDFGSTFDAEITSLTPGVTLLGIQAGVAAVPEADTWAMLLAGLGLVGFAARRRTVH